MARVELINFTPMPMETIWSLWDASKTDNPTRMPEWVRENVPAKEVEELFWKVIVQNIPVAEMIKFTFMLSDVSNSFREQMVRHRIGVKVGDRLGVDIIPEFNASSWWSQSMRIKDVSTFADERGYRVPETVAADPSALGIFEAAMHAAAEAYRTLVQLGVPMEDAREVIPLGTTHRISWDLNLQAMIHILAKRGCWILQGGIWNPIIIGMVEELSAKVHPMFRRLAYPPCIDDSGKFHDCTFKHENERRMDGRDALPPCPLYLVHHLGRDPRAHVRGGPPVFHTPMREAVLERAEEYRKLWGHDPYEWKKEG